MGGSRAVGAYEACPTQLMMGACQLTSEAAHMSNIAQRLVLIQRQKQNTAGLANVCSAQPNAAASACSPAPPHLYITWNASPQESRTSWTLSCL
jgi:hypothetical protein